MQLRKIETKVEFYLKQYLYFACFSSESLKLM